MTTNPAFDAIEPVRVSVRVRRSIDDAFRLFTAGIAAWWPLDRFSFGGDRTLDLVIEPFVGGRFYERYRDGDAHHIGEVLRWDPPHGFVYTWHHDDWSAPTEVEVRFTAEDAAITRVEVEHRAWERLGMVGGENRDSYANGWPAVIACFVMHAGVV